MFIAANAKYDLKCLLIGVIKVLVIAVCLQETV